MKRIIGFALAYVAALALLLTPAFGQVSTDARKTAIVGGIQTIAQSAVPVTVTGTAAETTLATVTVPSLGANESLRITTLWSYTNSANLKTMRVKVGATTFADFGQTTSRSFQAITMVRNRNSQTSQVGHQSQAFAWSTSTSTPTTAAENTAIPFTVTFTGLLALSTESVTLESYLIERLP